jgi:hypothetical protein
MIKSFLLILLTLGAVTPVTAHTYFFGLTDMLVNAKTKKIEIIHQFTAHDVDNLIAEQQQINFSPEHPQYEELIQNYFNQHFVLIQKNKNITLKWVGFEVSRGKIFVYQESISKIILPGLVVKNDLLVDTYPKQVNTVNYQDTGIYGSLTFSQAVKIVKIAGNN